MKVNELDEGAIRDIGHAFGYYDYGGEHGLASFFPSQEATSLYIQGYVRGMLRGVFLHSTGPRNEGFIAYKLPGQKIGWRTVKPLAGGMLRSLGLSGVLRLARAMKRGGPSLRDRFDKERKPYLFVGLVCVREEFQGQGYLRRVMDLAFTEGDRLGVPVILDTDAKSKCEKYQHLGMELAGTRPFGEDGLLYDLIRYPASKATAE